MKSSESNCGNCKYFKQDTTKNETGKCQYPLSGKTNVPITYWCSFFSAWIKLS